MNLFKTVEYLDLFDYYLYKERTGTTKEFATKLKIAERTLKKDIWQLREMGAKITFDYTKKTYKYYDGFRLFMLFIPNDYRNCDSLLSSFRCPKRESNVLAP